MFCLLELALFYMCGVVVLLFFTKESDYRAKRGFLVDAIDGMVCRYLSTMSPLVGGIADWLEHYYSYVFLR